MLRALLAGARGEPVDAEPVDPRRRATRLRSNALDPAFKGEAILLPSESVIADRMDVVDPDAIHARASACARRSAARFASELAEAQCGRAPAGRRPSARAPRAPAGCAASRSACSPPAIRAKARALAKAQFDAADNMTDRQGALGVLVSLDAPERDAGARRLLRSLQGRCRWCSTNGSRCRRRRSAPTRSTRSSGSPRIPTSRSPTRTGCARWPAASAINQWAFHHASGRGYRFLADMIIAADKLNPQVAARLVPPLGRWRRFEPNRAGADARPSWSGSSPRRACRKDVFEQASEEPGLGVA